LSNAKQKNTPTNRSSSEPLAKSLAKAAQPQANRAFAVDLARAFGGAIIFSFPMLMTMENWWLGFTMERWRFVIFIVLTLPTLVGLSYYGGFEETFHLFDDMLDAFVAYAVGFVASALMLFLFAVISLDMPAHEVIGKVAFQATTGSLGAMFAQNLLGGKARDEGKRRAARYFGQLFLMGIGAIFLAMSIAPTQEVIVIAYQMSEWHTLALILATLLMMHAFVYAVEFRGQEEIPHGTPPAHAFLRYTLVGYALALLISFYILWTFGRFDGMATQEIMQISIVLAFPAALGAAASRLIL